ncbi:MAG TPA: hypothetical protein VF598_03465 [Hymenobacter sp.]|jgi:hypothetical protein
MKFTTLFKSVAIFGASLTSLQKVSAQNTPVLISGGIIGNQSSQNFIIQAATQGSQGPYIEMVNNSNSNTSRAGSIGYIAGYSTDPNAISHLFFSRTSGGGWISNFQVYQSGKVQIGQLRPNQGLHADAKLTVDGKAVTQSLYVTNPGTWADFVFSPSYKRMPMAELETYINLNKHLPHIPSASQIEANGYNITEMDSKLLQTVEELTLQLIQLSKEVEQLKAKYEEVEN